MKILGHKHPHPPPTEQEMAGLVKQGKSKWAYSGTREHTFKLEDLKEDTLFEVQANSVPLTMDEIFGANKVSVVNDTHIKVLKNRWGPTGLFRKDIERKLSV